MYTAELSPKHTAVLFYIVFFSFLSVPRGFFIFYTSAQTEPSTPSPTHNKTPLPLSPYIHPKTTTLPSHRHTPASLSIYLHPTSPLPPSQPHLPSPSLPHPCPNLYISHPSQVLLYRVFRYCAPTLPSFLPSFLHATYTTSTPYPYPFHLDISIFILSINHPI